MDRHDSAGQPLERDPRKARILDPIGELSGRGKLAYGFDEVAIGVRVVGDDAAHLRDHRIGEAVVDGVEPGDVDMAELEAKEPPAALEHAKRLTKRLVDARHVA